MKKRGWIGLATLAVTLVVALGLAPKPALAEGGVAQIGEKTYMSLEEAVAAVPDDGTATTITLIGDAAVSEKALTIGANKSVVLDLGSHTLTVSSSKFINLQGSLTVQGSGSIAGDNCLSACVVSVNGGALTLRSGTISTNKTTAVQVARGTFTMEGGEVIGKKPIALTLTAASATIRAGKVISEGGDGVAIGMTTTPSLTVGVEGTYNTPIISGTIEPSAGSKLSLLGGTITGISGTVPSGTTFGSHFASHVDNLPEGYECVQESGYWVVRATLTEDKAAAKVTNGSGTTLYANAQDAAAALREGDTLVLLRDVDGQLSVKSSGSVTIDLNGCSVNADATGEYAISVAQSSSGTLTLRNTGKGVSNLAGAAAAVLVSASDPATVTLNYEGTNIEMPSGAAGIQLGDNARVPVEDAALLGNGGFETVVGGSRYAYGLLSAAAHDADEGAQIVLLADYVGEEPMEITEPGTFVVDLGGHAYETSATCAARVAFGNVDVTFKNGSIVSTSTSESAAIVGAYLVSNDGAQGISNVALTLEDVDLSMEHSGNAGVIVQGLNTNNTVTLDGCTLTVPNDVMGIYFPPAESTLNVTDTQITAGTGIGVKGGTLNISGNTSIHATGANDPAGIPSTGGIAETGAAIYVDGGYVNRDVTVNVTGGTFASDQGSSVQELVDPKRPAENPVTIKVAAGSFSDDSMGSYLAGGVSVAARADGNFGVYASEEDALANGGAYKVVDENGHAWFFSTETAAKDFATNQAGDATVETVRHTVTFDSRVPNEKDVVVEVVHGQAVTAPADPELAGWTFVGWYTDATFTTRYDFSQPVTDDLALVAQWVEDKNPGGTTDEPDEPTTPEPDKPAKPTIPEPTAPETEAEKDGGLAETGDAMLLAPLASSLAAGAAALGASLVLRRRNR